MSRLKIAVLGAGSFVFGPSVLSQAILERRLDGIELALMDVDADLVGLMAGVGQRMARETGVQAAISAHTDRAAALDGADFVIGAVAREMHHRFELDRRAIRAYYPGHLITEFGGVAGISYSLRQIALMEEIAGDMRRLCPSAWLLTVSNPLPRVCQAVHESGVKVAGFCSVSLQVYDLLWHMLHGTRPGYPFAKARAQWDAVTAGTNHFAWLVAWRDRASGADLLPELRARLAGGASYGNPLTEKWFRQTGYLLAPGDDHIRDFLPPEPFMEAMDEPSHGTPTARQERLALLRAIVEGRTPWDDLLSHPSWERPVDLIAALAFGQPAEFHSINLINTGQIAGMPSNVFVETPADASADGLTPQTVELPPPVLALCQQTAQVTDTIVQAAKRRERALVYRAVDLDPTIPDKGAGRRAMDACLAAHADILPDYAL